MGIEPTYAAWEAAVLPLNYTRAPGALYHMLVFSEAGVFASGAIGGANG